eukprot:7699086-Pyramimonas_sp.AAC.3
MHRTTERPCHTIVQQLFEPECLHTQMNRSAHPSRRLGPSRRFRLKIVAHHYCKLKAQFDDLKLGGQLSIARVQ